MVKSPLAINPDIKFSVEVKDAGYMGKGVFATHDIERGMICCYYDGIFVNGDMEASLLTGKRGYNQQVDNGYRPLVAGFPSQLRKGGCSQLINDFSITYKQRQAPTHQNDKRNNYAKGINVCTYSAAYEFAGTPVTVALKPIKKGDQLFVSYGEAYWVAEKKAAQSLGVSLFDVTLEMEWTKYLPPHLCDGILNMINFNNESLAGVRHRYNTFKQFGYFI
tara:strand:- start:1621 stop:2280 length:660 start_codon:yes stop_codon:yes gene_type:complete